jgi:hypothetical protein
VQRGKSRVSQWITAGLISGAAIVGEGRGAKIDAAMALKQLKERLAVDERCGENGLSTNLDWLPDEIAATPAPSRNRPAPEAREGEDPETEAKIKAEKLKQSKFLTLRLERDERAGRGLYMDAQEANAGMARVADDMLKIFEGAFPEFASALMANPPSSAREAIHLLRTEFRRVREQLAAVHGAQLATEAQTEEVD